MNFNPDPIQTLHHPFFELYENNLGSSSAYPEPHFAHAFNVEKRNRPELLSLLSFFKMAFLEFLTNSPIEPLPKPGHPLWPW